MDTDLFLEMLSVDSTSSRERDYALELARRFAAPGRRVETFEVGDGTLNLRVSWGEPKVFFCTHLDTVPPYIPPQMRPVTQGELLPDGTVAAADDLLFTGRGTCDAKGQEFAMYQACLRLEAAGQTGFALLLLAGEETGSVGAKAYARDCGGGEAVVVGEPTGGRMVSASKGTKSFEVVLQGRPCHSGYPSEGESAVERFVSLVQALRGYDFPVDPVLGLTTWNIGRLRSDNPQNILSPEVRFRIYFRTTFSTDGQVAEVLGRLLAPGDLLIPYGGDTPMHYWTAPGEPQTTVAFGSDAPQLPGFRRRALCGPGSILVAHTEHEYVLGSQLEAAAEQYIRIFHALGDRPGSVVMKFGGTSVQDAESIVRVREIVRARLPERPVVVVSAMARVTRSLVALAEAAGAGDAAGAARLLEALRVRHQETAEALAGDDVDVFMPLVDRMDTILDTLADEVDVVLEKGLTPRRRAAILSAGELLSSTLVAAAFRRGGIPARWEDARGRIVTDAQWLSAEPDLAATTSCVQQMEAAEVIVTQGFIAATPEGETTVLGFEGSDYSAALLGMALSARAVEIWTDVDGVRTADPRLVPDTVRIDSLSYDEAAAMAGLGARVLHPKTTGPARSRNIPIRVRDTRHPEAPGSVIGGGDVPDGPKSIALITGKDLAEVGFADVREPLDGNSLLSVIGRGVPADARLREILSAEAPIVAEGPFSLSILVPEEAAPEVLRRLHRQLFT